MFTSPSLHTGDSTLTVSSFALHITTVKVHSGHCTCRIYEIITRDLNRPVVLVLQVVCFRSVRCKGSGVDEGDHSAPRTEKTTAQDGVMLSPRDPLYQDHRSSQVAWTQCDTAAAGRGFNSCVFYHVPPLAFLWVSTGSQASFHRLKTCYQC